PFIASSTSPRPTNPTHPTKEHLPLMLKPNSPLNEPGIPRGFFRLEKFNLREDGSQEETPFEVIEVQNAYVNAGGAALLDRLIGTSPTAYDNTNANLGVGDSSTATSASQTDLQAATNKLRKG